MAATEQQRDSGPGQLEITGMGESCPLHFVPESAFGWQAYSVLIDTQCDRIKDDANSHGVAEEIDARAASLSGLNVRACRGKLPRANAAATQAGTNGARKRFSDVIDRKIDDAAQFHWKNRIYRVFKKARSFLLRGLPGLGRYADKFAQHAHPALSEAIENSSLIICDSMTWLVRNAPRVSTRAVIVALKSRIDHQGQGMSLTRRRKMSLVHFALHECEQNQASGGRLFVLKGGDDAGDTLSALDGNYSRDDSVLLLGQPSEILAGWDSVTEVARNQWLYRGVPESATKSGVPPEPAGGWPKISVITVSYNQADYIEACLRSILDQGYPALEYIVVDGNSDDGTVEILERYRDRISTLVIEPDEGQSEALNKGFRLATGDIMTWICSDDVLAENALFHIAKAFSDNPVDIVAGGCRVINGAGELSFLHHSAVELNRVQRLSFGDVSNFLGNWQASDFFFQPEVFFSRRIWEASGAFLREHLYYAMDYDLFLRMAMAGAEIVHIPRTIGVSRQHDQQKTQHGTMAYLPQIHGILSDYKAIVEACSTVNPGH